MCVGKRRSFSSYASIPGRAFADLVDPAAIDLVARQTTLKIERYDPSTGELYERTESVSGYGMWKTDFGRDYLDSNRFRTHGLTAEVYRLIAVWCISSIAIIRSPDRDFSDRCGTAFVRPRSPAFRTYYWLRRRPLSAAQGKSTKEVRTFATTTAHSSRVAERLPAHDCRVATTESTGEYPCSTCCNDTASKSC